MGDTYKLTNVFGRPDIGAAGAAAGIERRNFKPESSKKLPKTIKKIVYTE